MAGPRLRDPQVQRIIGLLRHQPIGLDILHHVGRFQRDADIVKALIVQQTDMAQGAFYQSLGFGPAVFCQQLFFQRAAVDADADRDFFLSAGSSHSLDSLGRADIARVDTDFIRPLLRRGHSQAVIEVDIRYQRQRRFGSDAAKGSSGLQIRHSQPGDLTARLGQPLQLRQRALRVGGFRVGHRLDGKGRAAAYRHASRHNLLGLPAHCFTSPSGASHR